MGAYTQCVAVSEIALGHLPEMLVGDIGVARVQFIPDFLPEFIESATEFRVVGSISLFEDGACRFAELDDEGFFPWAPGLFVGAVGIRIGEEQEGVHEPLVLHESCELRYHIGIIDVTLGGKTPQGEMMVDEEHDELPSPVSDVKALADLVSENLRAVDMLPDVFGSAGVVKKDGKVEGIGVFNIDENLSVASNRRVVRFYQGIQLVDTAEGMLIGGIAMKEFMLNKAFKSPEFREITAEDPASVHESQGTCDLPLFFQNGPEGAAIFLIVIEALVDPVPVGLD